MTVLGPPLPVRWKAFSAAVGGLLAATVWLRVTAAPVAPLPPAPPPHSVAVVPFLNDSPDSAYDYLSAGITGDLTGVLGRIPGLRVVARGPASAASRGDPPAIGRRLGVGSVLLGSVRQTGDRLRVSAQLVSVEGGFDVRSEAYERPAADLIAVENEIVAAVAAALRLRGPGSGPAAPALVPRTTLAAHTAYLRGRFALGRPGPGAASVAAGHFAEAVRLDSAYAPAWAGLAEAEVRRFVAESVPPDSAVPLARTAADRALDLDSTLVTAHVARAVLRLLFDRDPAAAGDELQRAIALNPNLAEGFHWQSHRLLAIGEVDSSLVASRRAIESSPLDPLIRAHLGWHYLLAGEDSLAAEAFRQAMRLNPGRTVTDEHLSWRRVRQADPRAAYDSLRTAASTGYVSPYTLAVAAAAAGQETAALSALSRAAAGRTPPVLYAGLDPRLDTLRRNRRFETLLARLRLTTIPTRQRPPVPSFASP